MYVDPKCWNNMPKTAREAWLKKAKLPVANARRSWEWFALEDKYSLILAFKEQEAEVMRENERIVEAIMTEIEEHPYVEPSRKNSWPFGAIPSEKESDQVFRLKRLSMPARKPRPGEKKLQEVSDRTIKVWIKLCRRNEGVYQPRDHYRDYTMAQLCAEKARRKTEGTWDASFD